MSTGPRNTRPVEELLADLGARMTDLRRAHEDCVSLLRGYLAAPGADHRTDRDILRAVLARLEQAAPAKFRISGRRDTPRG